jgi:hypothetical protein
MPSSRASARAAAFASATLTTMISSTISKSKFAGRSRRAISVTLWTPSMFSA